MEIDALVGSVLELGDLTGIPVPTIRAIYQAVKLLDGTYTFQIVGIRAVLTDDS